LAESLVDQLNVSGEAKALVLGGPNYGTINLGEARKLVRRFVDVPPLPPHRIVGRERVLAELRAALCGAESIAAVSALDGLPGVGKTTVAVRLAWDREMLQHFRAGVLWAGVGPQGSADGALNRWAAALGVELGPVSDASARARLVSLALQEKAEGAPVLLVVDDVWTWEQARPFKEIAFPGCAQLMTTRHAELARRFAGTETRVACLPDAEAEDFVAARCQQAREVDPAMFRELVGAVGGLPLGLELIAEELGRHEGQTSWVKKAMERLRAAEARLDLEAAANVRPGLAEVPRTLRAIVEMSVMALAEEEQVAFAALGAFAAKPADFGRDAVLAVLKAGEQEGDERLRLLVERCILEVTGEGRFTLHQVLGSVAAARLDEEAAPRKRHAGFYLALMQANREDWHRIESELEQIRQGWRSISARSDTETEVLAYVYAVRLFHERRGLQQERLTWLERGLEAARSLRQPRDEATLLTNIGGVYSELGEKARALKHYGQALPIHRAMGERGGEVATLNNIGHLHSELGEKARALEHHKQALDRAIGAGGMEAITLDHIGAVHSELGEHTRALEYFNEALPIHREVGDRFREAITLNNIGQIHSNLSDQARALEHFNEAVTIHHAVGARREEAITLTNIGLVHSRLGEPARALEYYQQALPIHRAVGNRRGEAGALNNIGLVHNDLGDQAHALVYFHQALLIDRALGDRGGEATTLGNIGLVHLVLGDQTRALEYFQDALPILRAVGNRSGEATTLGNIASAHRALGEQMRALEYFCQALAIHRAIGDRRVEAITLSNIGMVHRTLGDHARELEHFNRALLLFRAVSDRRGEAVALFNIASTHERVGKNDEAISLMERVVDLDVEALHPDLESDRAVLARMRGKRDAQSPSARRSHALLIVLALTFLAAVGWLISLR
jgi:tetratricopeptide (TPR) repeat protein